MADKISIEDLEKMLKEVDEEVAKVKEEAANVSYEEKFNEYVQFINNNNVNKYKREDE